MDQYKQHTRRILLTLYKNVFGARRFLMFCYWKLLLFGY